MDLESEPTDIVAALLLSRVERIRASGEVRREHPEPLRRLGNRVAVDPLRGHLFRLLHDRDIAIVRHREELQAPPIARGGSRRRSVGVRVLYHPPERVEAGPDRVVGKRREHDRIARLAHNLHRAADAIVDIEPVARRRESGVRAEQFHHEARVYLAHESHAGIGVQVLDEDLRLEYMHDVDVVPDALDREFLAANLHASGRAPGRPARRRIDRVGNPVVADERPAVVVEAGVAIDRPAGAAGIGQCRICQRIRVDADDRTEIVAEVVFEDHRLRAPCEDRRRRVTAAAVPVPRRRAGSVVLDPRMRHPQVALVHLEYVEVCEGAFDRCLSAAVAEVGVVDAGLGAGVDHDAAPVAGGPHVGQVAVGVERAARAEAVVAEAREDDGLARGALGDELGNATLEFDAGALKLHDHARIDRQAAARTGRVDAPGAQIAADATADEQVVLEDIDDVGAPQPCGHVEPFGLAAQRRFDLDEQAVNRVIEKPVAAEFRTDTAIRLFEAVRVGGDGGSSTLADGVEQKRRTGRLQRDRCEGIELRIHPHLSAAVGERGLGDRVDECLLRRRV